MWHRYTDSEQQQECVAFLWSEEKFQTRSAAWRSAVGGIKLVVSLTLAVVAMAAFVRSADAPQPEFAIRAYLPGHKKFFPDPMMGIRGDATVLRIPARA